MKDYTFTRELFKLNANKLSKDSGFSWQAISKTLMSNEVTPQEWLERFLGMSTPSLAILDMVKSASNRLGCSDLKKIATMEPEILSHLCTNPDIMLLRLCEYDDYINLASSKIVDVYSLWPTIHVLLIYAIANDYRRNRSFYSTPWNDVLNAFGYNLDRTNFKAGQANLIQEIINFLPSRKLSESEKYKNCNDVLKLVLTIAESNLFMKRNEPGAEEAQSDNKKRLRRIQDNIVNKLLTKLYRENWNSLSQEITNSNSKNIIPNTYPYMMAVPNEICTKKRRIMLFGISTNGWASEIGGGDSEFRQGRTDAPTMMDFYEWFMHDCVLNRKYISPFWDFYREIADKYDNATLIASNLGFVGLTYDNQGFDSSLNTCGTVKNIRDAEITIIDPNVCLFMAGHANDKIIKEIYGSYEVEQCDSQIPVDYLAKFVFSDGCMKGRTVIRTYHPGYLRRIIKSEIGKQIKNYLLNKL